MSFLEIDHLSYAYDEKNILSDVSFQVNKGENLGIIGPNGSGKTTLLRSISGLFSNIEGKIMFKGKSVLAYGKKELARYFAVVEQEGTPQIPFTVEEVVAMGRYPWLKRFSQPTDEDYTVIHQALKSLDLWEKRHKLIHSLSGGERQLVSLARAMVQEPIVLFLDEPTTYLDIAHQLMVMKHIRNWQKEKKITVIMVLHDLNLAAQNCDRLLLMNEGKIQRLGRVTEVLQEQQIEHVYKTKPIMIEHPLYKVPQIILR